MRFSEEELRNMAARASAMNERTAALYEDTGNRDSAAWLASMKEAAGGEEGFRRSLAALAISEEEALFACGELRLKQAAALPDWLTATAEILTDFPGQPGDYPLCGPVDDPVAAAVAARAQTRLAELAGTFLPDSLQELLAEYGRYAREFLCGPVFRRRPKDEDRSTTEFWHELLTEYPVLARRLAEFIAQSSRNLLELADTVAEQRQRIYCELLDQKTPAAVAKISTNLADRHKDGRGVHIVTFDDGEKAVFKPRSMAVDRAWGAYLEKLCTAAGQPPLYTPKTFDVATGAFSEFIAARPVAAEAGAARYFEQAGFITGAAWLLGGNDLHFENIIARGETPVVIDTETVVNRFAFKRPVMTTHMLPFPSPRPGMNEFDCGLTDDKGGDQNLPFLDEQRWDGRDFPAEVERGFVAAVRAGRSQDCAGATAVFQAVPVRLLLRATHYYYKFTILLCGTDSLRDGMEYEKRLCYLARGFVNEPDDRTAGAVETITPERYAIEYAALNRLDIPYLENTVDESWELERRLLLLDQGDLLYQRKLLRMALAGYDAGQGAAEAAPAEHGITWEQAVDRFEEDVAAALEDGAYLAAALRPKLRYVLTFPQPLLLEGLAGAGVALAVGRPDSRRLGKLLTTLKACYDLPTCVNSLKALPSGLFDGRGGVLLALELLLQNGADVEAMLKTALSSLEIIGENYRPEKDYSLLYGDPGQYLGLALVPPSLRDEHWQTLLDEGIKRMTATARSLLEKPVWAPRGLNGLDGLLLALAEAAAVGRGEGAEEAAALLQTLTLEPPSAEADQGCAWLHLQAALKRHGYHDQPTLPAGNYQPCQNDLLLNGNGGKLLALTVWRQAGGDTPTGLEQQLRETVAARLAGDGFRPLLPPEFPAMGFFCGRAGALWALAVPQG